MGVNRNILSREVAAQSNVVFAKIKPSIIKEFKLQKIEMLRDFDQDDVTTELKAGPSASSKFVSTSHGGNLYSLLGFPIGEDPTNDLRKIIEDNVTLDINATKKVIRQDSIEFRTPVFTPTLSTVNDQVSSQIPLPWTTRAFTDLIERGITGFSHYLYDKSAKFNNSFSTTAIEVKNTMRGGQMRRIPYVSKILAKFRKSIREL